MWCVCSVCVCVCGEVVCEVCVQWWCVCRVRAVGQCGDGVRWWGEQRVMRRIERNFALKMCNREELMVSLKVSGRPLLLFYDDIKLKEPLRPICSNTRFGGMAFRPFYSLAALYGALVYTALGLRLSGYA